MSSHREAPEISKDPVADNTDLYAFVSPDRPDTVTIIANYIPLEDPAGGPNFFEFGDDVLYQINIDNDGDGRAGRHLRVPVHDDGPQPRTRSSTTPGRSTRSTARTSTGRRPTRVTEVRAGTPPTMLGHEPARARRATSDRGRPRTTRASPTRRSTTLGDGIKVFAGQRLDGFYVDLGSVFDLARLRPFQNLHLIPTPGRRRASTRCGRSTCTRIAIQVPISRPHPRRQRRRPTRWTPTPVIGVWASAQPAEGAAAATTTASTSRRVRSRRCRGSATRCSTRSSSRWAARTEWNAAGARPATRSSRKYVAQPELAKLLPVLYPGVFPNLAALHGRPRRPARDPAHRHPGRASIPGFQNFTGPRRRPTCCGSTWRSRRSGAPNINGILGGDLAGFPNGRRVFDDVVTIELRAIAGADVSRWSTRRSRRTARRALDHRRARRLDDVELPRRVPVPRPPGQRLRRAAAVGGVMSGHHHHDHGDHFVGGGAAVLDIGGDVGALIARWMPTQQAPRSMCAPLAAPTRCTPECGVVTRATSTSPLRCSRVEPRHLLGAGGRRSRSHRSDRERWTARRARPPPLVAECTRE